MFIQNFNLRKKLGMSRLMEADNGAGSGGEEVENPDSGESEEGQEGEQKEKTFTQADVEKLIKERLARAKKGQPTKEELEQFNQWKESQKTEEEKKNEAITNAEKAKQDAEERALNAETKVTCLSKGVNPTSVDDVVVLAKAIVSEDVTVEQAIDKVLEKYPHFKGENQINEEQKGFIKIGSGGSKEKQTIDEALKDAFGLKK